jgi:hypothetical protein
MKLALKRNTIIDGVNGEINLSLLLHPNGPSIYSHTGMHSEIIGARA